MSPATSSDETRLTSAQSLWAWLGLAVSVALLAAGSILLTQETDRISAIWPVNAVVLAVLLRIRPASWPWALAAGGLGCLAANLTTGDASIAAFLLAGYNQVEVFVCAWICRRFCGPSLDTQNPRHLTVFAAASGIAAMASALLASSTLNLTAAAPFAITFERWFIADGLGLLVLTPALLAIGARSARETAAELLSRSGIVCIAWLISGFVAAFLSEAVPLYVLIFPPLVFSAFRLSAASTAVLLMGTVIASVSATVLGLGWTRRAGDPAEGLLVLQMFLATATFCALGVAAVVANLRRANARIQASEQELRHLIDSSADIVVRLDREGRVTWIAPSCRRLGYAPEDLVGRRVDDFIHPEDAADVDALRAALFAGKPVVGEEGRRFRLRKSDGSWELVDGNPSIVRDEHGRPLAMVNLLRDVTAQVEMERRVAESESRFRLLTEGATDIVTAFNLDAKFTYVSPSIEAILGYRPEDLIGRSSKRIVHPDDFQRSMKVYNDHLGSDRRYDPFSLEYRAFHKDGHIVWLQAHPRATVSPETGEITGYQDIIRDISRRKALEEELIEARDAAEAAARAKADFMANMSHEIRTPLTAILGFTSLLKARADLAPDAEHQLKRISAAGQSLLAIVNDVLDFSKIEAGQMPIRPRPASLSETLSESLALFEPQAAAKGIALELVNRDLGHAEVDSDRLRQVLLNLIGNAVKFTETGGVTVTAVYDEARERLRVAIRDTGPGMDAVQQAQLFQRFSQVDGSSTRRHGGTGLGLAICRGLVEAMGGEIGVKSWPGEGSEFYFEIDAPKCSGPVVVDHDGELADLAAVRVLVVDDNSVNRELVRALLSSLGMVVSEAADGLEAVSIAQTRPYDVILMDIRMPNLDGPDATLKIRNQPGPNRDIPILAFTADHDLERFGEHAVRGFDGKVDKPINGAQLVAEISRHLALEFDSAGTG